jgi:hypothetical protein
MKVQVYSADGELLWERDAANNSGITSRSNGQDGTLVRLVDALTTAAAEASGELLIASGFQDPHPISVSGWASTQVEGHVPDPV